MRKATTQSSHGQSRRTHVRENSIFNASGLLSSIAAHKRKKSSDAPVEPRALRVFTGQAVPLLQLEKVAQPNTPVPSPETSRRSSPATTPKGMRESPVLSYIDDINQCQRLMEFLKGRGTESNLLFYQQVQQLKRGYGVGDVLAMWEIYTEFISRTGAHAIPVEADILEQIDHRILFNNYSIEMYDEAVDFALQRICCLDWLDFCSLHYQPDQEALKRVPEAINSSNEIPQWTMFENSGLKDKAEVKEIDSEQSYSSSKKGSGHRRQRSNIVMGMRSNGPMNIIIEEKL